MKVLGETVLLGQHGILKKLNAVECSVILFGLGKSVTKRGQLEKGRYTKSDYSSLVHNLINALVMQLAKQPVESSHFLTFTNAIQTIVKLEGWPQTGRPEALLNIAEKMQEWMDIQRDAYQRFDPHIDTVDAIPLRVKDVVQFLHALRYLRIVVVGMYFAFANIFYDIMCCGNMLAWTDLLCVFYAVNGCIKIPFCFPLNGHVHACKKSDAPESASLLTQLTDIIPDSIAQETHTRNSAIMPELVQPKVFFSKEKIAVELLLEIGVCALELALDLKHHQAMHDLDYNHENELLTGDEAFMVSASA